MEEINKGEGKENEGSHFKKVENNPPPHHDKVLISQKEFAIGIWHFEKTFRKEEFIGVKLRGLYREGVLRELLDMGFYKRQLTTNADGIPIMHFIHELDNRITLVVPDEIKDAFYQRCIKPIEIPIIVKEFGKEFVFHPKELVDKYLKQYFLLFNDGFLIHLENHTLPILEDTEKESYFFFKNFILKTSMNGKEEINYSDLDSYCVWEDHIIKRDFEFSENYNQSHMAKFISNVTNNEQDRENAFLSAIGYLIHSYNTETRGQAVVCYDESPSKKGEPMGGTGKGLLANAIKQVRSLSKIDGKKYRSDDKFKWQLVKATTQVVFIDDVQQNFSFDDLHSLLTDGMNVEKKYQDEFLIPPIKTPKFILTSNTILNGKGTTNERRQFIIEFSDHYSKALKKGGNEVKPEPIKEEHGCIFFSDEYWKEKEWNEFYSFMIQCSLFYFKHGMKGYALRNVAKNTFIQSTNENFVEWVSDNEWLKLGEKRKLRAVFEDFRDTYYGADSEFSQGTFTKWLKVYANSLDMDRKIFGSNKDKDLQFIPKEESRKVE